MDGNVTMNVVKKLGWQLYLTNPYEHMYEKLEDMPKANYLNQSYPIFAGLVFLEIIINIAKGRSGGRLNEHIMSASHGTMMQAFQILTSGTLFKIYLYLYEHYTIYELPWDSSITWFIAALAYDCGYYWFHRAAHEINIFWATHQVHHSSEDYNLSTAIRQSMFQNLISWPFYLPMAFFVPPPIMLVHSQFNLIFQFWIHTEAIKSIGPLEYIFNTASHHRVHHGSNRYCLDKNYAGVLIIWDRMFGTFEAEKEDEEIVYGLVDQPQYFNPFKHQFHYFYKVFEKAKGMDNWMDSIYAFIKGPGWFPGTPRLGDPMGVPAIQIREKYNPKAPQWANIYVLIHFAIAVVAVEHMGKMSGMSQLPILGIGLYLIWSISSLGLLFDNSIYGWVNELLRSIVCLVVYHTFGGWKGFVVPALLINVIYGVSLAISTLSITAYLLSMQNKEMKQEANQIGSKKQKSKKIN